MCRLRFGDSPCSVAVPCVDVADVGRLQAGFVQRQSHRLRHRGGLRLGDVAAIAVGAETDQFGVDGRATRQRMVELFQHQRAGAFAEHEAIAFGIERTRCHAWLVVVPGTGREQGVEHRGLGVELFGAAGQHRDLATGLDRLVRIADALAARRAGAGRGDDATAESVEHADVDRRCVRHHADVGGRVDAFCGLLDQHAAELAERARRARRRAVQNAHAATGQQRIAEQAGIDQREFAGARRHQRDTAHAARGACGCSGRAIRTRRHARRRACSSPFRTVPIRRSR